MSDILKELDTESSESSESEDDAKEEEEFNEPLPVLDMITLISKDGKRVHLQKEIALQSGFLQGVFGEGSQFKESKKKEMVLSNIRGEVLEKVADYLHYYYRFRNLPLSSATKFDFNDKILIELLVAADFLQI